MNDHILQFWNLQADKFGTSHSARWGDKYAIDLEIQTIGRHMKESDKVLDVGCANGYSAIHHLDKNISSITGVDSSEGMIREAKKTQAECGSLEKLFFEVGDVRKLRFENDTFDVVYTTRTLINLPTWDEQKRGISECIRVCKVGGTIIFSEAFWEPLVLLNSLRSLKSLTPLVEPDFNRYLKKKCLEEYFLSEGIQFEIEDFSRLQPQKIIFPETQAECGSLEKLFFEVGDVRKLRFENDTFDVVYTTRTLINLPTWDEQKRGISECIRVCKVGGTIIFSEAFWEPLVLLNSLRSLKSLTPLVEPDFNRYLKKKCLEEYFLSEGIQFEIEDFSSIYFLGTRFLRELVTNPEDDHGYSGPINTIFYNIEKDYSGGGFGIQQAYVIQKSK